MKAAFCAVICLILTFLKVNGHSWVECTDYSAAITGNDYSFASCNGYPRNFKSKASGTFGQDVGWDFQPEGTQMCEETIGTSANSYSETYDSSYPMAQYVVGSTIRLVWPAKNHANYECKQYIPDNAMQLYVNTQVNPSSDLTDISQWTLVLDWHAQAGVTGATDDVPFQNCPAFCEDTDKAVCYGDFTVPSGVFSQSGYYTFLWWWEFNTNSFYTSCWEAYVDINGDPTAPDASTGDDDDDQSSSVTEYYFKIPIEVSGATYNSDTLENAVEDIFDAYDMSFSIGDKTIEDNYFEASLYTSTEYPKIVTTVTENGTLCTRIASAFGGSTTCDIGDGFNYYIQTEAFTSTSSTTETTDATVIVIVFVAIFVAIIIIAVIVGIAKKDPMVDYDDKTANQIILGNATNQQQTNVIRDTGDSMSSIKPSKPVPQPPNVRKPPPVPPSSWKKH